MTPLVPFALILFLHLFLILAGIAGILLFTVLRLLRQPSLGVEWKETNQADLANRQTYITIQGLCGAAPHNPASVDGNLSFRGVCDEESRVSSSERFLDLLGMTTNGRCDLLSIELSRSRETSEPFGERKDAEAGAGGLPQKLHCPSGEGESSPDGQRGENSPRG